MPLTSSVYVPGKFICFWKNLLTLIGYIEDNTSLLVDFGTGFYVERNIEQGMQYCGRKAQLIKENMENVTNTINQKGRFVDNITITLQRKLQQLQQQAPGK